MTRIKKEDLKKILNWLIKQITPTNKEWLMAYFPDVYQNIQRSLKSPGEGNHDEIILPSIYIKIILDAKAHREPKRYVALRGFTARYVRQLARMLNIKFIGRSKDEILRKVLEEIDKQDYIRCTLCRGEKVTSLGGRISPCPKCRGMGKIKKEVKGPYISPLRIEPGVKTRLKEPFFLFLILTNSLFFLLSKYRGN